MEDLLFFIFVTYILYHCIEYINRGPENTIFLKNTEILHIERVDVKQLQYWLDGEELTTTYLLYALRKLHIFDTKEIDGDLIWSAYFERIKKEYDNSNQIDVVINIGEFIAARDYLLDRWYYLKNLN